MSRIWHNNIRGTDSRASGRDGCFISSAPSSHCTAGCGNGEKKGRETCHGGTPGPSVNGRLMEGRKEGEEKGRAEQSQKIGNRIAIALSSLKLTM